MNELNLVAKTRELSVTLPVPDAGPSIRYNSGPRDSRVIVKLAALLMKYTWPASNPQKKSRGCGETQNQRLDLFEDQHCTLILCFNSHFSFPLNQRSMLRTSNFDPNRERSPSMLDPIWFEGINRITLSKLISLANAKQS